MATGVDLVGLRVFDDAGNGYFSWVEDALQWTVANISTFEHDITAVNLSLGTYWNSDSNPSWAMLEDEFAALEAAGVFISVSAGNDFTDFNTKGVSYPASSDHVIPVMSVDNNGNLSYFSQRAEYAIAAPGRAITSTVPDYAANDGDTIDDDWQSKSGTSMAAPYVAGSSVLVREAMEFVGMTDIDQWDIYDHMMATADTFYDSATDTNYQRLNLEAAIDALMPEDDFGSSVETAHNLGTLNDSSQANPLGSLSGVISTLDDADYFTFTAGSTGTVTFSASESHALDGTWDAWGGAWSTTHNGDCVIDVVAGQTYTVSLSTADGLGYYDLNFDLESSFAAIDWGAVAAQETQSGLNVSGEAWYSVTAGRTGYLTVESLPAAGSASVEVYDAQQNLVGSAGSRVDVDAIVGEQFMLRVVGDSSDFDLRLTNAVTLSGSTVTVVGTEAADAMVFSAAAASRTVSLNGVAYSFDAAEATVFSLEADSNDTAELTGSAANEQADLSVGSATLVGAGYQASATGAMDITIVGGGGVDTAVLVDSLGDDRLAANATSVSLYAADNSFMNTVRGFDQVSAFSSQGADFAYLTGSAAGDVFSGAESHSFLRADDGSYDNHAYGFDRVFAYAGAGGADVAYFSDSAGNDVLNSGADYTLMRDTAGGYYNYATGFATVHASSLAGGFDLAYLTDSVGDDVLTADPNRAVLRAADYSYVNTANGFDRVFAYATAGGEDLAYFVDSSGDDTYTGRETTALMTDASASYYNLATSFERVFAYSSNGGTDWAHLHDSAAADTFVARPTFSQIYANDQAYYHRADGFDRVYAYAVPRRRRQRVPLRVGRRGHPQGLVEPLCHASRRLVELLLRARLRLRDRGRRFGRRRRRRDVRLDRRRPLCGWR